MVTKIFKILIYLFAAVGFALVAGYFAVKYGVTNEAGIIDTQRETFLEGAATSTQAAAAAAEVRFTGPWQESEEWSVVESAVRKDQAVVERAAHDSGVPARLIVANLVGEQLRFFFTEREAYKKWFYPLKILGPQSQFSWGVMGMKEDTAIQVEANLKDPTSPYYPGPQYEHLLDFTTDNVKTERFVRMTDQHNHYWSYLYAGLYLKEIEAQWQRAGFPIEDKVDVLSTLYNIGFKYSVPKANPAVGGAAIPLSDGTHSFGALAKEFYDSALLIDVFER